jgi:phospholipase A-2-activating protein
VFVNASSVASASRDGSLRLWQQLKDSSRYDDDGTILTQASGFLSSVSFLPPSSPYPDGLLISGARDGMIELRSPKNKSEKDADVVLVGHGNNVCALDVSEDGRYIVSGSWDATARIWEVGKWEPSDAVVLQGHNAPVWGVLAFSDELVVTGKSGKFGALRPQ